MNQENDDFILGKLVLAIPNRWVGYRLGYVRGG